MPFQKKMLVFLIVALTIPAFASAQKLSEFSKVLGGVIYESMIPISELHKHINEEVYLGEVIWGTKMLSDSVKVLYMGGIYPNHKLSVYLKGRKVVAGLSSFTKGSQLNFSGKLIMENGIPIIVIDNLNQVGVRVQI